MRPRTFTMMAAAVGIVVFLSGTASAQYRGYYTPSNYGNPGASTHQPSFGMSNSYYRPSNFGNPGANPVAYSGTLNAGSNVPLQNIQSLPMIAGAQPLGGGLGTYTVPPAVINYSVPTGPAGTSMSGMPANASAFGQTVGAETVNPATTTPAGTPQTVTPAPTTPGGSPITMPTTLNEPPPSAAYTQNAAPAASPSTYVPGTAFVPRSYYSPYSGPQYQSSFYDPLRRVYGYQGY